MHEKFHNNIGHQMLLASLGLNADTRVCHVLDNHIGPIDRTSVDRFQNLLSSFNPTDGDLIVDLQKVMSMKSVGYRILLATQKTLKENGHELILLDVPMDIMVGLERAGFTELFKIKESSLID